MPKIRPGSRWVSAGAIVGVIGALAGALLCCIALWSVNASNRSIVRFEKAQAQLLVLEERLADSARMFAATGEIPWRSRHKADRSAMTAALNEAWLDAPSAQTRRPFEQLKHANRMLETIQTNAIANASVGERPPALDSLVSSEHQLYSDMFGRSLEETARGVEQILQERLRASYILFGIALSIGIGCSAALLVIWRRVGQHNLKQALALEAARDALAEHAASLEDRIVERTADLEAAKLAAERADRAKSEFLASMSHEIRTPLNGVLGMADALAKTPLDERQVRMIGVIQESGDTLLALLNDVLDLAKIESGLLEIENVVFCLEDAVRSAESIFTTRAQQKGLSFSVAIEPDVHGHYLGDPTRLRQVLYNLVSNAVKFTAQGEVRVKVSRSTLADGNGCVSFAVSDTGIGISEEARSRLFQKFMQADTSTTRNFGGTGLGLAICSSLVSMMGGEIIVETEVGKGSVFSFGVPLQGAAAPKTVSFEAKLEQGVEFEPFTDIRVLAAEDNAHNRLVLKLMLEPLGINPTFVENGRLAVEAWQRQAYDIVLMDVQMPVLSGLDATREIRALEATQRRSRTPIIALTANAMNQHVVQCREAGMDFHVSKPIQPQRLFAAIENAMNAVEEPAAVVAA